MTPGVPPIPSSPATFGGVNQAVFGVFEGFVADADTATADAWLRATPTFTAGTATCTNLTITAYNPDDRRILHSAWPRIRKHLDLYVGHATGDDGMARARTTLLVTLDEATQWTFSREEQLRASLAEARHDAEDDDVLDLLAGAIDRGRVVRAGSASCGTYDMLTVLDLDRGPGRAALSAAVQAGDRALHRSKIDHLNNLSPVVSGVTTTSLARALATHVPPARPVAPPVGVVVPGLDAAPEDVLRKLRPHPLDLHEQRVPVRKADLTRRMVRAVDLLCSAKVQALVIGYGGGERTTLDGVHAAVCAAVAQLEVPVYVGIGHANFTKSVPSADVRTCTTPADAATLFIVEALEAPRRRLTALAAATHELRAAEANPELAARALTGLQDELRRISDDVDAARKRHLQDPPRS